MGRWTQYDEDDYRLPDGFKRVAYDADTRCYTYRDNKGILYEGAPGNEYGILRPKAAAKPINRPVFVTDQQPALSKLDIENAPETFEEILPSDLIASPSSLEKGEGSSSTNPAGTESTRSKIAKAVRTATIPKMQEVALGVMRRSATMINRRRGQHDRAVSDSSSIMQEKKSLLEHSRSQSSHASRSGSLNEKGAYGSGLRRSQSTASSVSMASSMLKPLPSLPVTHNHNHDASHSRRAPPTRRPSHGKPADTSNSATLRLAAVSSLPSVPTTTPKAKPDAEKDAGTETETETETKVPSQAPSLSPTNAKRKLTAVAEL